MKGDFNITWQKSNKSDVIDKVKRHLWKTKNSIFFIFLSPINKMSNKFNIYVHTSDNVSFDTE